MNDVVCSPWMKAVTINAVERQANKLITVCEYVERVYYIAVWFSVAAV